MRNFKQKKHRHQAVQKEKVVGCIWLLVNRGNQRFGLRPQNPENAFGKEIAHQGAELKRIDQLETLLEGNLVPDGIVAHQGQYLLAIKKHIAQVAHVDVNSLHGDLLSAEIERVADGFSVWFYKSARVVPVF